MASTTIEVCLCEPVRDALTRMDRHRFGYPVCVEVYERRTPTPPHLDDVIGCTTSDDSGVW